MTVKEIALAVGKDASTVARWVQVVSCKMQEVSCKMQEAKATSKPADYTLNEACQIIEQGMGKDVADVFRANAVNAEMTKPKIKLSGAMLAEVNKSFDRGIIDKNEARALIGLNPAIEIPANIPMIQAPLPQLSKQAYAVEMKQQAKAKLDQETKAKSRNLF